MFNNSIEDRRIKQQTQNSYTSMELQLEEHFSAFAEANPRSWGVLKSRLEKHFPQLFFLYFSLYKNQSDFDFHLKDLLIRIAKSWIERSTELKQLDTNRENNPHWYQSNQMLGGVCYVDLFADNLENLRSKIPYFKELGLTYLHIMPPFKVPEKENDGGYAVSSYREVNPAIGTIQDLADLADDLRNEGISLALDFIFNHTSDEHRWALDARKGDQTYQSYYHIYPDRLLPDAYEAHLREIFPEEHPGAFTFYEEIDSWVWTTFHTFQWDLNYANPVVFNNMIDEMLFLANLGVEILRLDAVAFTWKELGTSCENLPEAHILIQAFNAAARIAAPALLFKSGSILALIVEVLFIFHLHRTRM